MGTGMETEEEEVWPGGRTAKENQTEKTSDLKFTKDKAKNSKIPSENIQEEPLGMMWLRKIQLDRHSRPPEVERDGHAPSQKIHGNLRRTRTTKNFKTIRPPGERACWLLHFYEVGMDSNEVWTQVKVCGLRKGRVRRIVFPSPLSGNSSVD